MQGGRGMLARVQDMTKCRWVGAFALTGAVLMLVAGETVLKERLRPTPFLLFWIACFGLTVIALGAAFLDMRSLKAQTRKARRQLLDSTLEEIAESARRKKRPPRSGNGKAD
jgi:hypothetical protein